ncbi:aminotransferase class V-fold PLP-dependent enzyme, partial [Candidatus Pacearchaeota archaeon]|nr:aminotransferase class V-fold PLP-dependent enzyme [Candidatus Pacearchaeota archaeon]
MPELLPRNMIFDKKLDAGRIRRDFPTLGKMIYADSACMSLKPRQVIEKMNEYYYNYPACAGRSAHRYGRKLEEEIARARKEIAVFIGAKEKEIIFTKNATEALNLAANGLRLKRGDEVIITDKEHSSNIIPWLKLKKEIGIKVVICNTGTSGIDLEELRSLINNRTKLISAVHVSNLDGMENDISGIVKIARKKGVRVMIDACQSAPHKTIDVKKIDCDFLAFSGHKMLGPTGTGVLYGKLKELEKLGMFIVGGETVLDATYEDYKPEEIPARFEAGLQNYSGIIGLGEACRYLKKVGMKNIEKHEKKLGD